MKYRFKTHPFRHQRRATIKAVKLGNMAFFMDPRTGKTKAVLDAVGILALKGKCRRVVVITTLDGIGVWQEEISDHFPFEAHVKAIGEDVVRIGNSGPVVKFFLLNYEQYRSRKRPHRKWVYAVAQAIEHRFVPDVVVLDESHRVKRAGGVTAQIAWRSVRRMRQRRADGQPFVYLLTGTPHPKGWQDLFAQFRVMDETIFGTAKSDFEGRYCEYGIGSRRYTIVKYHRVPEIKRIVRDHSFIISEERAFPDMPAQLWQNVPVTLPPEARRIYNDMAEELVAELQDGEFIEAANTGARRIRLLQITGGFTTDGRQIHGAKGAVLESVLDKILTQDQHVVVYCRFLPEVDECHAALERAGFRAAQISGATPRRVRHSLRREFNAGKLQGLAFQVETGSEAISLAERCHEMVFYSLPDGWKTYWQATRRVRGPRQQHATRYRHLIARGTLDRSVLATLQKKGDMHAELMRNPKLFLFGQ